MKKPKFVLFYVYFVGNVLSKVGPVINIKDKDGRKL